MPNPLETFLSAGFAQAKAVMGDTFTLGSMTGLDGIFSAVDTSLQMEVAGYLSEADWKVVADKAQFTTAPALNNQIVKGSDTYRIVEIAEDGAAYVLGLKKLSV